MVVFLFPGQGSQYVGMGRSLYERSPEVKKRLDQAGEILSFDLPKLCFDGPAETLVRTQFQQPTIFALSVATWEYFQKALPLPLAVAGHSLGEYSALVASGRLSFEDGLLLVKKRGELMEEVASSSPKAALGMMAFLGGDRRIIESALAELLPSWEERGMKAELANDNGPGQQIAAGHKLALEELALSLKKANIRGKMLAVNAPFHSSFMREVAQKMRPLLEGIRFSSSEIPIVPNLTGILEKEYSKEWLISQIDHPVLWADSARALAALNPAAYVEFGPSDVLGKMTKRILAAGQFLTSEKEDEVLSYFAEKKPHD